MSMRIDGEQPAKNAAVFTMEQLKSMTKQQLLTVFDKNKSGTVSDAELASNGMTGEELSELKGYMKEVGIEEEIRATKTGFTMEQLLAMTKEQILMIFDGNKSGTVSKKEIKDNDITEEQYVTELKEYVKSLGIEETEKAVKTDKVTTNKTDVSAAAKPAQTQTPKTGTVRKHRFAQVPVGQKPHKVTPPKDIKLPLEAKKAMGLLYYGKEIKVGNFICSDGKGWYGDEIKMVAIDKKTEYHIYTGHNPKSFTYLEFDEKLGEYTFRLDALLDGSVQEFGTTDYDKWGREVRYIIYDKDGKPIHLVHYTYDADEQQHRKVVDLDELK